LFLKGLLGLVKNPNKVKCKENVVIQVYLTLGNVFEHLLTVANCFVQFFEGNNNSKLHRSILKPPIVVELIRIVPELYKDKQVCLRFELLGCPLKYGEYFLKLLLSTHILSHRQVLCASGVMKFCQ